MHPRLLFLLSATVHAILLTTWPAELVPGQPATITWAEASNENITLSLLDTSQLNDMKGLAVDVDPKFNSLCLVPDASLPTTATYMIRISQSNSESWSNPVPVTAAPPAPPGPPRNPTTAMIKVIFAVTGIICLAIIAWTGLHVMIIYIQFRNSIRRLSPEQRELLRQAGLFG